MSESERVIKMRVAFKLNVKFEYKDEYIKRHNPIWAELEETLFQQGVITYSIFLEEKTGDLFGYAEIKSLALWNKIAESTVCQKWWTYMAPLMQTNSDHSPTTQDLAEVFHIRKP